MNIERDKILTVGEVATYLAVHPSTIYRLLRKGKIPAFKIGSDYRFVLSAIIEWTEKQSRQPQASLRQATQVC